MKTIKQKFVLDESGSMLSQQRSVIDGFNEQLNTMKQEELNGIEQEDGQRIQVKYLVTLIKFSDTVTILYKNKQLSEVEPLTTENYVPSGWTALYDAIGAAIDTAALGETDTNVTIMTDGFENKSREWKKNTIKTLIDIRQRENKWGFVYFGAEQNAWAEASSIGIANAVNYTMANTGSAIFAMNSCRSAYVTTASSGVYDTNNLTANVDVNDLVK